MNGKTGIPVPARWSKINCLGVTLFDRSLAQSQGQRSGSPYDGVERRLSGDFRRQSVLEGGSCTPTTKLVRRGGREVEHMCSVG